MCNIFCPIKRLILRSLAYGIQYFRRSKNASVDNLLFFLAVVTTRATKEVLEQLEERYHDARRCRQEGANVILWLSTLYKQRFSFLSCGVFFSDCWFLPAWLPCLSIFLHFSSYYDRLKSIFIGDFGFTAANSICIRNYP